MIETTVEKLIKELRLVLKDSSKKDVCPVSNEEIVLKLSSDLADSLPFSWEFRLSLEPPDKVCHSGSTN